MTVALVSSCCMIIMIFRRGCVVNRETAVVVSGQTIIDTSILYNKNDLMQLKPLRLLAPSLALALLRYYCSNCCNHNINTGTVVNR